MKNWLLEHKEGLVRYGLLVLVFLIGLVLPSPFFRNKMKTFVETKEEEHVDTTNMAIAGGEYSGSIIRNSQARDGYGRFVVKDKAGNETVFEGNWKNNKLEFGTRTNKSSIYTGHFDADLQNNGFGIINYSDVYIKGKSSQGFSDSEIIVTYIGNWRKNYKHGLGRVIMKDGSMDFGMYSEGILKKARGSNYKIGGNVYGIDVSHWQADVDWDNLALYCDKNGNVLSNPSQKEKTYMQPVFFVYLKATEGATVKDEMYSVRMIEAERHGITKGAYHFLHLGSPVEAQLRNFFETVSWVPGDLPPALDVELEQEIEKYGVQVLQSVTLEWLEQVEKKLGVRPVIYTRESIRKKYFNDPKFEKYKFWIARYGKNPDNSDWQIWQMTERGAIRGCQGGIDIDIFRGDYDSFKKYLTITSRGGDEE